MQDQDDDRESRDLEHDDGPEDGATQPAGDPQQPRPHREGGGGGGQPQQGERRREFEERRRFRNARELMTDELLNRARNANPKLRAQLLGSVLVTIKGSQERYLLDWSTEEIKVEATQQTLADCMIKISEDNLLKIASGDLNPQIGMLSEKIHLEGNPSLAVYFFNLIAPRSNLG